MMEDDGIQSEKQEWDTGQKDSINIKKWWGVKAKMRGRVTTRGCKYQVK